MASTVELTDGIKNVNPKPEIRRYYNLAGTPYVDISQVLSEVPNGRYQGQLFNVAGVEYWFKDGTTDGNLVAKVQAPDTELEFICDEHFIGPGDTDNHFMFGSGWAWLALAGGGIELSNTSYDGNSNGYLANFKKRGIAYYPPNLANITANKKVYIARIKVVNEVSTAFVGVSDAWSVDNDMNDFGATDGRGLSGIYLSTNRGSGFWRVDSFVQVGEPEGFDTDVPITTDWFMFKFVLENGLVFIYINDVEVFSSSAARYVGGFSGSPGWQSNGDDSEFDYQLVCDRAKIIIH